MNDTQMRYPSGTKVIFRSKHGRSSRTEEKATVLCLGNHSDESGVAHGIVFIDGHQIWAYPKELTLDTEK